VDDDTKNEETEYEDESIHQHKDFDKKYNADIGKDIFIQSDRFSSLQNSVDHLINILENGSKEKFKPKISITPGDHVLLPTSSKLNHYIVTLQRRWTSLAHELKDKMNDLDNEDYLKREMASILVRIWRMIDNYLLNDFYKTMLSNNVISRFMILDEEAVTDVNIKYKVKELQSRADIDQTTEYIVPVIVVVRKGGNDNNENDEFSGNPQDNTIVEKCDYFFYLVFNTSKILEEIKKPSTYSIHSFSTSSLQSVLGHPPNSILELPYDPESDDNDPSYFERNDDITNLVGGNILWKLVLMCLHAIAHVNTFLDKGYNMRRGCEHDDLFNQQLMLMFPMTFMNAKYLPPFVKNIMNVSNIIHRY
jgi:hypothetical protein